MLPFKKNIEIAVEQELEAAEIVQQVMVETARPDMEAWEMALLETALAAGTKVLGRVLSNIGTVRNRGQSVEI